MSHSKPNVAQADAAKDMRSCWIVGAGMLLVGVDAEGLELRCLAHYMQDAEYIAQILEGDIHWFNALAAGFAMVDEIYDGNSAESKAKRNQAKTFIYAFLYGQGDKSMGAAFGKGAAYGKRVKAQFLAEMPALADLKDKVERMAKSGTLPAIDGRRLRCGAIYSSLNTLLQGCGALVMKWALVHCYDMLIDAGLVPGTDFMFVANIHDEYQIECRAELAEKVGEIGAEAIVQAGVTLGLRMPMAGAYQIGINWSETH